MKKIILSFLITILIFSEGYAQQINGSFLFEGMTRTWIVYIPQQVRQDESLPLLLALHGLTQSGQTMMQFSDFSSVADTGNFIVCYPDGVGNAWNVGFAGGSTANDVGFLSALIDTLHVRYNIDLNRVYATGFSNGGFMSYRLACELSDRIAAIAPVSGTMTEGSYNSCQPGRKVPVLHIHGTSDLVVNYNGGFGNVSVDQVLTFWNDFDNCPAFPVIVNLPDLVAEGSTVQRYTWSPCDDSTDVMLLKVLNGGHTWPGSVGTTGLGNTNRDIIASNEIWSFLRHYSLDLTSSVDDAELSGLKVYPNPVHGLLTLECPFDKAGLVLSVYSADGKPVSSISIEAGSRLHTFNTSDLNPGLYLLRLTDGRTFSAVSRLVVL